MHKALLLTAYGWLTVFGILHFLIDVVSHHVRHVRAPGPETTLYYGLHASYALGQVAFGLFALLIARRHMALLSQPESLLLAMAAGIGWLLVAWLSMPYWQPKVMAGIFLALLAAAAASR